MIPFTIAMKRIKRLGINLPKETKDLYIENSKTLMKEIKESQTGNKEVKLSLLVDVIILHTENPKTATKKIQELINKLGKVVGYKINKQKSVAFLYTNNELIRKTN